MEGCVFCRIVAGRSPADVVYQDDAVVAFRDIYPKAAVHVLIVPRRHVTSLLTVEPADGELLGRCLGAARRVGELTGFGERGYRIQINAGPEGGQVVDHLHLHFLAGGRRTAG